MTITSLLHAPAAAPQGGSGDAYVRNMFLAGVAKNVLDVGRSAVKLPEAFRAGTLAPALAQTLTASPTTHIIDPRAPRIATAASAGKSFTALDEIGYRTSSLIGVGVGVFQVANGVPNIARAVARGGAVAIVNTREGRTGVLQAAGGALTLGAFARAGVAARAGGVTGAVPVTLAAASAASLSSPWMLGATLASSGLVLANDHGFMDFMNKGEQRSFGQVQRDSWQATGINGKVASARDHTEQAAATAMATTQQWVKAHT